MTSTSICSNTRQGLFDSWMFFAFVAYEATTNLFGNITPSWPHLPVRKSTPQHLFFMGVGSLTSHTYLRTRVARQDLRLMVLIQKT